MAKRIPCFPPFQEEVNLFFKEVFEEKSIDLNNYAFYQHVKDCELCPKRIIGEAKGFILNRTGVFKEAQKFAEKIEAILASLLR